MEQISDGKGIKPLFGHTPGHTGYLISDGSEQLLIWADIVHSAFLQCPMTNWGYSADVDKDTAIATRIATFSRVAAEKALIAGMHLPFPGFGHLVEEKTATPSFRLLGVRRFEIGPVPLVDGLPAAHIKLSYPLLAQLGPCRQVKWGPLCGRERT